MNRILYINDYGFVGNQSPTVNERIFLNALESDSELQTACLCPEGTLGDIQSYESISFYTYVNSVKYLSFLSNFILPILFVLTTQRIIRKYKPDTIVVRQFKHPLRYILLSVFLSQKLHFKSIGRFWTNDSNTSLKHKIAKKIHHALIIKMFKMAASLECVTDDFANALKENGCPRELVFTQPNTVDDRTFYPGKNKSLFSTIPSKAFPILGYAGSEPTQRGGKEIISLLSHLQQDYPNIYGIIVGRGNHVGELTKLAKQKGVIDRVLIEDWVPFEDMPALLAKIDIGFAFTEEWRLSHGNSSMKIRQYISSGVPVITHKKSNEFIQTHFLGSLVDQENLQECIQETYEWIKILSTSKIETQKRLHEYASTYLSARSSLKKRKSVWFYRGSFNEK